MSASHREPRRAVVSALTSTWPSYLTGAPSSTRDFRRLDFAINLICLSALVDAVAAFDSLVSASRAYAREALPHLSAAIPVQLIDPNLEAARFLSLYGSQSAGGSINQAMHSAIETMVWYDTLSASYTPADAEAWRDVVATELAAAMVLASQESCPLILNSFEASLAATVDPGAWRAVQGPSVFRRALDAARLADDILPTAVRILGEAERQAFAMRIAEDGEAPAARERPLSDSDAGVTWYARRQRGVLALVAPIDVNFGRIEALFDIPAADVELQISELVRPWRRIVTKT